MRGRKERNKTKKRDNEAKEWKEKEAGKLTRWGTKILNLKCNG